MNRMDWASLTDEVIMDLESMNPPLHECEENISRMLPRECHPTPISLLIAEVKRLRDEVKDLKNEIEEWKWELNKRMCPIEYEALVNGGKEE